jgi:polyisoprenoid-binding protein YceI
MLNDIVMASLLAATLTLPALAAEEKYTVDPNHTYPSFEFSHMGISVWRGKFDRTKGDITVDRAAKTGTANIVVDVTSIDFGLDAMNDKARSEDFLNVAKFPAATYHGTLKFAGDSLKTVEGYLTLMGVTQPVTLTVNSFKCIPHPMLKGMELCGADAEGDLNWSVFGMRMSKFGEGDAGKLHLRIQVEAVPRD